MQMIDQTTGKLTYSYAIFKTRKMARDYLEHNFADKEIQPEIIRFADRFHLMLEDRS